MLDQATYTPRLKALFKDTIRAALKEEFGYKNDMQIPKLDKIVLNMGIGEAVKDTKKVKQGAEELSLIAGQKAVITKAKNSIAGFRVREEMPLGAKVNCMVCSAISVCSCVRLSSPSCSSSRVVCCARAAVQAARNCMPHCHCARLARRRKCSGESAPHSMPGSLPSTPGSASGATKL